MTEEEKLNSFKEELVLIKSQVIKDFATKAVVTMPDYFFTMPASTTGRYHPKYALGEGGLLRHTKGMIKIAVELMRMESWKFTEEEHDLILVSMILHDGWKLGDGKSVYTSDMHPLFASDAIKFNKDLSALLT